ncbi:hypothetical protein ES703_66446 [subsurface metagenome]
MTAYLKSVNYRNYLGEVVPMDSKRLSGETGWHSGKTEENEWR